AIVAAAAGEGVGPGITGEGIVAGAAVGIFDAVDGGEAGGGAGGQVDGDRRGRRGVREGIGGAQQIGDDRLDVGDVAARDDAEGGAVERDGEGAGVGDRGAGDV